VTYEVEELNQPGLTERLAQFVDEHEPALARGTR
jgi:hypothetical protein